MEGIRAEGLSRMKRRHIHFAMGDQPVSGFRGNCEVLIYVDVVAAISDGFEFFVSENGVVLSEGNHEGVLPVKYFEKIVNRKTGENLSLHNG